MGVNIKDSFSTTKSKERELTGVKFTNGKDIGSRAICRERVSKSAKV